MAAAVVAARSRARSIAAARSRANSSHIRLAQVFGNDNVTFTDVDGPDNTKIQASVLFPRDPTRRLELLWNNPTSRSGTQVIAINGKSNWTAPRGVKLGAQLAAVEKLNGKPFKLTAFGADGSTAADWQEGQMLKLQGGCKIGMRFVADPRTPQDALRSVQGSEGIAVERHRGARAASDGGGDPDRILSSFMGCTLRVRGAA